MAKNFLSGILGVIVGALLVIFYLNHSVKPQLPSLPSPAKTVETTLEANTVTKAVEKIIPSVVNIDTKAFVQYNVPSQDPFGRFFGVPPFESQIVPQMGQGSGVIVSADGLILTNEHVVHGASEIMVTLNDNARVLATIKGADQLSDIAILKVEAKNLVPVQMGDSDKTMIGETVIAVGNPYKFEHTVTVGVLSGRGRSLSEQSKDFQDLLQTDAAINPGNSGGPLVNIRGEVIGINTAIVPYAQGIGFAIPVNTAKNVMDQLVAKGKVSRPYIGIYMQDLNETIAGQLNLPVKEGVIIVGLVPGSPAERAHLQPKDVVQEIGRKRIKDAEALRRIVKETKIGQTITMKILRDGESRDISLEVGEGP